MIVGLIVYFQKKHGKRIKPAFQFKQQEETQVRTQSFSPTDGEFLDVNSPNAYDTFSGFMADNPLHVPGAKPIDSTEYYTGNATSEADYCIPFNGSDAEYVAPVIAHSTGQWQIANYYINSNNKEAEYSSPVAASGNRPAVGQLVNLTYEDPNAPGITWDNMTYETVNDDQISPIDNIE